MPSLVAALYKMEATYGMNKWTRKWLNMTPWSFYRCHKEDAQKTHSFPINLWLLCVNKITCWELPSWLSGKEPTCQCRRPVLNPGLGRSLEKEMATLPSLLAWESNGQRNLGGCSPWDHQWVGHDLVTKQGMEGSCNLPKGGRRGGREMGCN